MARCLSNYRLSCKKTVLSMVQGRSAFNCDVYWLLILPVINIIKAVSEFREAFPLFFPLGILSNLGHSCFFLYKSEGFYLYVRFSSIIARTIDHFHFPYLPFVCFNEILIIPLHNIVFQPWCQSPREPHREEKTLRHREKKKMFVFLQKKISWWQKYFGIRSFCLLLQKE